MDEVESKKSWIVSLILCFFLGIFGIHNFYAKKIKIGIIQLVTLGGLGIWTLIDLIGIIQQKYSDKNGSIIRKKDSENEVLKLVVVFMIISIIGSILFTVKSINVTVFYKNNDYTKNFEEASKQEPGMQVFLFNDATQKQIDEVEKNIRAIDGVSTTEFISKEEALNTMKNKYEGKVNLSEYEGKNNIFSASFIVKIKDQSKFEKIYKQLEKLNNVKNIKKDDLSIKTATKVAEQINVILILLIILIIMVTINTLGKIIAIILIFKNRLLKNNLNDLNI